MKEGPRKRDILSRPASKKAAARPRSAPRNEPKPVPVPLPEGVRHQRAGETTERSTPAHLEKLKQLFEAAPISRYLGMTLPPPIARTAWRACVCRFGPSSKKGMASSTGGSSVCWRTRAGNFAVGSVSPGSTVKTKFFSVEFKMSLLAGVQEDLLAIRRGRPQGTHARHLPARGRWGQRPCGGHRAEPLIPSRLFSHLHLLVAAQAVVLSSFVFVDTTRSKFIRLERSRNRA